MKTKGLSKEEALKQLDLINKRIEFNNFINKECRKYMKANGLADTFSGYRDQATPEMIEMMTEFVNGADFLTPSLKREYIGSTAQIFGRVYSPAVNTYILKDKKDCESFLKTFERAENNAEEENSLFRVERNTETTRMNLYFDGKPEQEVISQLKHHGFKWSPKMSCWTRQLTENAEWSLKRLKEALKEQIELADNKEINIDPNLIVSEETFNELSSINLRNWYHNTYSTDDLFAEIPENATFETLKDYLDNNQNVYELLTSDSVVRERAFEKLGSLMGVDYNAIYNQWVNSNLDQPKHVFISYRDYIKDLPFGPYVDNTERIKEARANFNRDIKNCDVVLVESRKSYDPEGISSDWVEDNIMYAGDLESVRAKLNEIVENGKNDKYQTVTKFNEDTYQIYYENAISKVTYSLMDNPLKEKYNLNDEELVKANAKAKGYFVKEFSYFTGNYVAEKEGIISKFDINGEEQLFTKKELAELRKSAWHASSEAGANDKTMQTALFFDTLENDYDKKFTILKEYPNIDYVLARNNNLNAPEPYVAGHYFNEENRTWGQGHYFTNMDDALDYLKGVEKEWLNNVNPDLLLDTIRDKFNDKEISSLENSIYNKNDSGKVL